jgi:PAS domain S-box-containing protein
VPVPQAESISDRDRDLDRELESGPEGRAAPTAAVSVEAILDALRTSEERWRVAALVTNDAIWDWDVRTHRVRWGIGFRKLFGYELDTDETDLSYWSDRIHPDDRARVTETLHRAAELGVPWIEEYRFLKADGNYTYVEDRGDVVRDAAGRVIQMVGGITDISLRKAREVDIRRQNEELEARVRRRTEDLERAVRELDAFSYSVSHDLRAPLRSLDGYSRILEEEYGPALDDTARGYLRRLRVGAQRMGSLIDDLLAFSRLGRQPMSRVPIGMTDLVRRCVEEIRADSAEALPELHLAELPDCVGDPALLRQVWLNLLTNACKYSKGRSDRAIWIDGSAAADEEAGQGARFVTYRIRDNGVGFDGRFADRLFQVFQRLHASEEFEGTGVGLAIVKRIVERHGGQVAAQGAIGVGAEFRFSLPRRGADRGHEGQVRS